MRKFLISTILLSFYLVPGVVLASELNLNLQYPTFGEINLNDIAQNPAQNLNKIIAWFYYLIVGIAGLSAFVMLVWGGVQWLTSAGDPGKLGDAKDKIYSALLGLLIILGSWLIVNVINPELTRLVPPTVPH